VPKLKAGIQQLSVWQLGYVAGMFTAALIVGLVDFLSGRRDFDTWWRFITALPLAALTHWALRVRLRASKQEGK